MDFRCYLFEKVFASKPDILRRHGETLLFYYILTNIYLHISEMNILLWIEYVVHCSRIYLKYGDCI